MDKRVIFAVAGSGKTSHIIDGLTEYSRTLLITYTENNLNNLKTKVLNKFGIIPSGIRIYSYYTFLYSFCFRPILGHKIEVKGISWDTPPAFTMKLKRTNYKFYIDRHGRLYHNRISKILDTFDAIPELIERLEKYFDNLCIDEIQDFGGHDFNLICRLADTNINFLMVGDFYQHTFDTSRDGNVNSSLHKDYTIYQSKFIKAGLNVDLTLLSKSYRCSPTICEFVSDQLGIEIESHRTDETEIQFIECNELANQLFECNKTVKLFYQSSNRYFGYTENWGATKGQDCYENVCVVLNPKTLKYYHRGTLQELTPQTKNKLYVAFTRVKGNLYLVPESMYEQHKK